MVRCVGVDIRVKKYAIGNGTIDSLTGGLQPVKHKARPLQSVATASLFGSKSTLIYAGSNAEIKRCWSARRAPRRLLDHCG
jgi:hypothetical protein